MVTPGADEGGAASGGLTLIKLLVSADAPQPPVPPMA